jgi:hypothetical protein
MRKKLGVISFFAVTLSIGAATAQNKGVTGTYYNHPVECISVELDGSLTLRAAGNGRNRADALEQARKNAVHAVIFKGMDVRGQTPSTSRALVPEVNAEQKYQYFFNPFFADGGKWHEFVSKEDTRAFSNKRQKGSRQVEYTVTIRVDRARLREYLVENSIIKP